MVLDVLTDQISATEILSYDNISATEILSYDNSDMH
jgi:hypothetical protein